MQRQAVSSSNIRAIGYDASTQILEIEFNGGGIYQYYEVPNSIFMGLMSATSHGRYFHAMIKDKFRYQKVG